jgi:DNA polymerase-1
MWPTSPQLKQAFADGLDIHAMTASEMFGVPIEGMDPMVRRQAKAINFGIIYGISAFGLANQLGIGGPRRATISRPISSVSRASSDTWTTPNVRREHGYVETIFGRRRIIPRSTPRTRAMRAFMSGRRSTRRSRGRRPISSAGRWCAWKMRWKALKLDAQMLLQVHDELIFEVPDMENACDPALKLSVPLQVDARAADNWDEAHATTPPCRYCNWLTLWVERSGNFFTNPPYKADYGDEMRLDLNTQKIKCTRYGV